MSLSHADVRSINKTIQDCLDEHLNLEGFQVEVGGGRFSDTYVTFKLKCAKVSDDGEVQSEIAVDFKRLAGFHGLHADDLNTTVNIDGSNYKIIGLKRRARKNNIVVEKESNGTHYVIPASRIVAYKG